MDSASLKSASPAGETAVRTRIYLADCRPLGDAALFARLAASIPAARREKLARLRNENARRLSLGAWLLLARALADEGLAAREYAEGENGKPFFPSLPGFHFNLSHSGERTMCAVSARPLGCDLERLHPMDERLVRRFFHPEECGALLSLPEEERAAAFTRLWTLKESYLKATGLGLGLPLDAFALTLADPPALTVRADKTPWRFRSFQEGEYFCALCAQDADGDVPILHISFHEEARP